MNIQMKEYLKLMRIHQWVKNFFIFLPLFFAFKIHELPLLLSALYGFIGFCMVASSIYIINDWKDISADRLHPEKRNRPLASGKVGTKEAFVLFAFLLLGGLSVYAFVLQNLHALLLVLSYFVLNIMYSVKLKHIPIVDICIVAIGFVIRVFIGGVITDTPLSRWIVIMTFLLAMLLVLGKRRDDVVIFEKTGNKMRKNLDGYNLPFLDVAIVIVSAVIIVAYIMYTISPEVIVRNGNNLYLNSFFVFVGLFRYLQILFIEQKSGSPTDILLKDRFMHVILLLWLASFFVISVFFK